MHIYPYVCTWIATDLRWEHRHGSSPCKRAHWASMASMPAMASMASGLSDTCILACWSPSLLFFWCCIYAHCSSNLFLILHLGTLIAQLVFGTVFMHISALESRRGGLSIKSIGSLPGGVPHELSGEGGLGVRGPLPPVRPSFIYIHVSISPDILLFRLCSLC